MAGSFADTQPYLVEEPDRSIDSTSTTSPTKLNTIPGNDNIPQKRPYTSIFDVDSLTRYSDNAKNVNNQNNNNNSSSSNNNNIFDETSPILPDEFGNPSPFTNSTDALSSPYQFPLDTWWDLPLNYQQPDEQQQRLLSIMSDSDIDGDDEADSEMTPHENITNNNNSHITGLYDFVLDESRMLPAESQPLANEAQQQDSSFADSIRISDIEDSDSDNTEPPAPSEHTPLRLNFMQQQQQQQSEHNNPPHRPTSNTQPKDPLDDDDDDDDDGYDSSAIWDDFPDLTGMVLPGDLDNDNNSDDTAPYDVSEHTESATDDDDGKNKAPISRDMDEPAGPSVNEDTDSAATVPYDVGEPTADDDGKNKAPVSRDMDEPAGPSMGEDADSAATVPYDVGGPAADDDGNSPATLPYCVDGSEEHVLAREGGGNDSVAALYNEDGHAELGGNNASDTSSIYDMDDFDGFDFGLEDDINNINCGGRSPLHDDYRAGHSLLAPTTISGEHKSGRTSSSRNNYHSDNDDSSFGQSLPHFDLNDLEYGDRTSNDSSFVGGDYCVFDSQPNSSYNIGDGYGSIGYNNSSSSSSRNDCMTSFMDSTHWTHTTSGSPSPSQLPQSPSRSPRYNSMTSSPVFHDSSNESHHQHYNQEQEQHDPPMSTTSATMRLETLGKGTKSDNSNHSQQKKHQQTSIEAFYSQLSMVSSLSTAKSFSDSDDELSTTKNHNHHTPSSPRLSSTLSPASAEQELVVSCSPPRKNPAIASLDQLRMAKIKKRSTLSPKKDERWLPVSRNLSSLSSSPPLQQQRSHSSLSDSIMDQEQEQDDNVVAAKKVDTPPSPPPTDRLKCRPPQQRRWIIGLSKPKNASSLASTSIASMLGREYPTSNSQNNSTLQPTNTITKSSTAKSIPPRKKTLGMVRQRAVIN